MSSPDRFKVISSLDVLNKLCQLEKNESFIENSFSSDQVGQDLHEVMLFLPINCCIFIHIAKCSHCRVFPQRAFFDTLVAYLSLHDIHLLISALECLHSLSCLGENSCNAIVRTHGALDALVSLVTVEAQSYGPKVSRLATD